jgi:hypothetical protein
MHPSLRVNSRLVVTVVSVVVGFGFGGWPPAEAVHEPAGVVPVDPGGCNAFQLGQGRDRVRFEYWIGYSDLRF